MCVLVALVVSSVQHDTSNTRHINVALAEGGAALCLTRGEYHTWIKNVVTTHEWHIKILVDLHINSTNKQSLTYTILYAKAKKCMRWCQTEKFNKIWMFSQP